MKKLFFYLTLLLLTAGLAITLTACSNDYDDPPEQPGTHQNETPTDSTNVNPQGGSSDDYTVILPVPVSDEVIAFFDEALPYHIPNGFTLTFDILYSFSEELPDGRTMNHPSCYPINSEEELKGLYSGEKTLPKIDFNNYTLIIGAGMYLDNGYSDVESFAMEIRKYPNHNELVMHTDLWTSEVINNMSLITSIKTSFYWGVFPKITGDFEHAKIIHHYHQWNGGNEQ